MDFRKIKIGSVYSRSALAELWGYASYHAIARGVVTPRDDSKIVLFVTVEKQSSLEQYRDQLVGDILRWEGPNDHFAEDRMLRASTSGDEIHLFYRHRHHMDFTYLGKLDVRTCKRHADRPSQFEFKLVKVEV
jgi:putative restriction endonuclease